VSRWWSDGWQLTLAPDGIAVARVPRCLGGRRRPADAEVVPVPAGGERGQPWSAALAALAGVVADIVARGGRRDEATVILSNHFVHYALVPWSDLIESDEEGVSLARHHLAETYGAAAERWQLRIAGTDADAMRLVSAVEPELLDELRRLIGAAGLRLVSIQPRLMAVCNRHRQRLGAGESWLALVEPGSLCLALLQGEGFAGLRQARLGEAWTVDLATTLERESLLAESAVAVRQVFVAGAGVAEAPLPPGSPWTVDWLEALAPVAHRPLTLAAGG
jgi:hypothetical protein